jgi:hypothetical protein
MNLCLSASLSRAQSLPFTPKPNKISRSVGPGRALGTGKSRGAREGRRASSGRLSRVRGEFVASV